MPNAIYVGDKYILNQSGGYGYEWMNAASDLDRLLQEFLPTLKEYGDVFGFLPKQDQPQAIQVQPVQRPWYQDVPPWVWGVGAAVGAVVLFKLLED